MSNNDQLPLGSKAVIPGAQIGHSESLSPRLAWMKFYEQSKDPDEVCNKFHISRKTFYKWFKRYREAQQDSSSLIDRSRKPHHSPNATPESQIQIVREAKERTGFGQRRLRAYLIENYNITLSERTIWRLLKSGEERQLPQSIPQTTSLSRFISPSLKK